MAPWAGDKRDVDGAELCSTGSKAGLPWWNNWDGYQRCSPVALYKPVTEQQIIDIIQYASSHNLSAKATPFFLPSLPPSPPSFVPSFLPKFSKYCGLCPEAKSAKRTRE